MKADKWIIVIGIAAWILLGEGLGDSSLSSKERGRRQVVPDQTILLLNTELEKIMGTGSKDSVVEYSNYEGGTDREIALLRVMAKTSLMIVQQNNQIIQLLEEIAQNKR